MKFTAGNRSIDRNEFARKVDKPDPNGNRQQRRAAKKIVRKATK